MAGAIIWYELMTTDALAARAFYMSVLDWKIDEQPGGDMDYRMISAPDGLVGGLMAQPAAAIANGAHPAWAFYILVDDVDAAAGRVTAAGGIMRMPPFDIPGTGRIAFLTDPQGAPLFLMTAFGDSSSAAHKPGAPGHGSWHELHATDGEAALGFYTGHFGWAPDGAMDMGPGGLYRFFKIGEVQSGGIYTDPQAAKAHWAIYFQVADIEAAAAKIAAAGGTIQRAPMQVPDGNWIVNATDPQGARFSLVGPKP